MVLSSLSADLDLFAMRDDGGTCNSERCLAFGDTEVTFDVSAGQTYYLVVDGSYGDVSAYTLSVDCLGASALGNAPAPIGSTVSTQGAWSDDSSAYFSRPWTVTHVAFDPGHAGSETMCVSDRGPATTRTPGLSGDLAPEGSMVAYARR